MAISFSRKPKSIRNRIFNILIKTVIIIFLLLLVVLFLIQTSFIQNLARRKIQSYLQSKLHTRVDIGGLTIRFPEKVILKNVYLEDQQKDTLLYGGNIEVDISMLRLLNHEVKVNELDLDHITLKVKRLLPDSSFNFAYIVRAFSNPAATKSPTTEKSNPFVFILAKIHLQKISLSYRDDASGLEAFAYLGNFETQFRTFDLANAKYSIPDLRSSEIKTHIRQYKPLMILTGEIQHEVQQKDSSLPLSLQIGTIDLQDVVADYSNEEDGTRVDLNLGTFSAAAERTDLSKQIISLKSLDLRNTTASFNLGKSREVKPNSKMADSQKVNPASWKIDLSKLDLENNNFQYDDQNKKPTPKGIDYAHLKINGLRIHATELSASPEEYRGLIRQLSFSEKSGLTLKNLSTSFLYNRSSAKLENFVVQTGGTMIRGKAALAYLSPETFSKSPGDLSMDMNFDHARLALKDLLVFVPSLSEMAKHYEQSVVHLDGRLNGRLNNLVIQKLTIDGLGKTVVSISGTIKGLPNAKKAYYDIHIGALHTSREDLEKLLPHGTIPASIQLPEIISSNGYFKGTIDDFVASLNSSGSLGDFSLVGSLNRKNNSFRLDTKCEGFDLGYLLKEENNFGKISLQLSASGQGFDYKTMQMECKGTLMEGFINGYDYKGLVFDGALQHGKGNWQASINDPNIAFHVRAATDFGPVFPAVQLNLRLDTMNLEALHLVKDTLNLKLNLVADFANTDPDAPDGHLKLYNLQIANGRRQATADTVFLLAERKDSMENIVLHSEMEDIQWRGHYKLTEVPQALEQTLDQYYKIPGFNKSNIVAQQWQLEVLLRPSAAVIGFFPSLKGSDSVKASMNFDSRSNKLDFDLKAPRIQYGDQLIRGLEIGTLTRDQALHYRIKVAEAGPESFHVNQTSLEGSLENNVFFGSLLIKDIKDKNRYLLSGKLSHQTSMFRFELAADSLLLNYDKWNLARDNFILYDSSGIVVHNLNISNKDQHLEMTSTTPTPESPILLSFNQFQLKTLSDFLNQDSLLIDGILNGRLEVQHLLSNPVFTSDLRISDLAYNKDTIGNVLIKINNLQQNAFGANISLDGPKNQIKLEGTYYTGQDKTDIDVHIGRFDLSLVKAFSQGQILDIRGSVKGDLHGSGNLNTPVLTGSLNFDSALVTPFISGEPLKVSAQKIDFTKEGINFNKLILTDSAGDQASINGKIYTQNYKDYRFDLTLNSHNFRLVNAPKEINRLFYGKLNLDADMKLSGDMKSPKINADMRVNKQTDFTVILPSSDPEEVSREGVVVFRDKDHPEDSLRLKRLTDSLSRQLELKGMDVTATIETDSSAQFTMIIDERNGDALAIRGRADLAGGIDKSGKMSLTGNYELDNGSYNVSLSVLKRKFDIQRGSTITWTGDPSKANINITATYIVNAPPIDLIQQQLSGMSQDEVNRFKQKLPFHVNLVMKGELLKPILSFDISLPDSYLSSWPEVDNKLTQIRTDESEVNKQVFALLLLNRFVEENPFASAGGGSDAGLIARQSVSRLLSDQLNQLAGSLIKGVDINFDMNSDQTYYTGQGQTQTELNVAVSKKLFNDRVSVKVGSNFQLESVLPGQSASNLAGDISVDYRLSKDGRYSIRAYRKDQYNTIVEGQVVETGLSFILTFDYNKFRELFEKRKQKKPVQKPTTGNPNPGQ
jgi:TamB, inner membrane protein subunit of TAM complex